MDQLVAFFSFDCQLVLKISFMLKFELNLKIVSEYNQELN